MQCACCQVFTNTVLSTQAPLLAFCVTWRTSFLMSFFILCDSALSPRQYKDFAQGRTGTILPLFCCIDFSAIKHYTESGSGDNLRSVPKPSSLWCGWLTAGHSTAPCGVISMLSLHLCLTFGQSMYPLRHTTVSSSTLTLSDGSEAVCCSQSPNPPSLLLMGTDWWWSHLEGSRVVWCEPQPQPPL